MPKPLPTPVHADGGDCPKSRNQQHLINNKLKYACDNQNKTEYFQKYFFP